MLERKCCAYAALALLACVAFLTAPARGAGEDWVGSPTPETMAQGLKELGLTAGQYGLADELEVWRESGASQDTPTWANLVLRYQGVRVAEATEGLTSARKRRRLKATPEDLLGDVCTWIGPSAAEQAKRWESLRAKGVTAKDEVFKQLAEHVGEKGRRWARARIRLAYVKPDAIEAAIRDLIRTFPDQYRDGQAHLAELPRIRKRLIDARQQLLTGKPEGLEAAQEVFAFQQKALLANPLLAGDGVMVLKRSTETALPPWRQYASSCEVFQARAQNEIAVLGVGADHDTARTIYSPQGGRFVGHLEIDYPARRVLFTEQGELMELRRDDGEPRKVVTGQPDFLNSFDGCYLPDGRIVFSSTAGHKGVPCEDGGGITQSLFLLSKDRKKVRRLTFDQDHDWHPVVANDGRVLYTRWDYTDAHHYYARLLFGMNPDGSAQMALYGSNSYFPNGKLYSRMIPWDNNRIVTVELGHVEPIGRYGRLLLLDLARGQKEEHGVVQAMPRGRIPLESHANYLPIRDFSAPRFTEPWPLADAEDPHGAGRYFLASVKLSTATPAEIYLVDVFDNMVCLGVEEGWDLREPILLRPRYRPRAIPDRVDPEKNLAAVNLVDVYAGSGLAGVPRGTIKSLRIYAYHFGYHGIGGHHAVGINSGWDCRRIIGTVPVEEDGSAFFKAPANLPLAVQPLDEKGQAVQIMRSWFTLMPGETASCVGCHESRGEAPDLRAGNVALRRGPTAIQPWYGPDRPFSYTREVQPVLDRYCVGCHDGSRTKAEPRCYDLRNETVSTHKPDGVHEYRYPEKERWPLEYYPPSYRVLQRYVRRPMMESDYVLRNPGEYHASTSPLVRMLRKGHHGVKLNDEAWDRLITWIDLNVPAHGTWTEVARRKNTKGREEARVAQGIKERLACDEAFGGPGFNPEVYPDLPKPLAGPPIMPERQPEPAAVVKVEGWPMTVEEAREKQKRIGVKPPRIELGDAGVIELSAIPAGKFVMGDEEGYPDERPRAARIDRPFWMATTEVTNAQFAKFDPDHYSGYFDNLGKNNNRKGLPLNQPEQPAIRMSLAEAQAFCKWLSQRTGLTVRLPGEAEWEYACRAGAATPMHYGGLDADFSAHANLADKSLIEQNFFFPVVPLDKRRSGMRYMAAPLALDHRYNDGITSPSGTAELKPNAWGLHDMHGNVREWTTSLYASEADRDDPNAKRVVRGGSWMDRPEDARCGIRRGYEPWRRVHNVGFRIVVEMPEAHAAAR